MATVTAPPPAIQQVSTPPPPPLPTQQQIFGGNALAGVGVGPIGGGGGGGFSNASLYVGDLDPEIRENELVEIFGQVVPVISVRVCRDLVKRSSLGYAYVNFNNFQDAVHAMEVLNFTLVRGKPIRIMLSHRDPSIRKSGRANVFIKNLDASIDNKALHDTFATFGTILSCKVATDNNGQTKGYGFVQFEHDEAAQSAIDKLNGMLLNDKQVYVGLFVRRQERSQGNGSVKFTNVYVKNLAETITDEEMKSIFGKYGLINSAVVMRDANGNSRGFGFINFQNPDDAASAVENLNGSTFGDKVLYVGKAQRKVEREAELKAKFEQERNSKFEKLQGANLYLKNLDDNINDEKLKELFSEFGTITSCKVMLDPHGQSRGSGFVAFSTPDEASRAVNEMNGKMIGRKPLYVAVAQRKEERKARLQAQFSQFRAPGVMTPAIPSGVPGYHPGTPRLGPPQLYYGQGTPGLMPPQPAGYGFQQQLMPGIRPGVNPNFMMPYHLQRQGQPGQRMGVRRGGPSQQMQQQQQMVQRNANQGYRYMSNSRNGMDPAAMLPQGLMSPMMPMPMDIAGMPVVPMDANRPSSLSLASALASATPERQRVILGEQLFPLVDRLEHDNAGKVTGMLLEMDQTEVLHLIESPDALKKKVAEAMEVLRMASANASEVDQLGSLSLND
ncbi:Polyadenylate-binding protein 5 [Acorus gramineus]|uniref:Polyadenylate-binding protein n=1 Tax=Acorus gramineus TaxID=55184 RepID=A0AAV9A486_ACOGR|nr:Polyadenylate-binding protein 5 [Acorus gramineus]